MNHFKKIITIAIILSVLCIALFVSLFLKNRVHTDNQNSERQYGYYTVENEQLGYRFNISDQYFRGYQEERQGTTTYYYLPTTDAEWNQDGIKYADVFTITAIPITEAEQNRSRCENHQEVSMYECIAFTNASGRNDLYYFVVLPTQDAPKDIIEKIDPILEAARGLETFNPAPQPEILSYENLRDGYTLKFPSFLRQDYIDNTDNSVTPPFELPPGEGFNYLPGLSFTLPIEYCSLSGRCKSETNNFAIAVSPISISKDELFKSAIGKTLTNRQIGEYTTYQYEEGAEGEGIIYYFIPTPNNTILAIALKYLNEAVVTKYAKEPRFIKFSKQTDITEQLIGSITFLRPLNQ